MSPNIPETEEYLGGEARPAARRRPKAASATPKPTPDPKGPRQRPRAVHHEKSYSVVDFLRDYRTHLGFGIFLCLAAIVMVVSGISFIFTSAADQSIIHAHSIQEVVSAGDTVENVGGVFGAKLAELMLVNTFGLGSFILAFYIFVIGLAVMRVQKVNFFSFTFRCLFSTAAVSIIVGLFTLNRDAVFNLGGTHGRYINIWLDTYAGALGTYCASLLLAGLLVAVFLYPLKRFFTLLGGVMKRKKSDESGVEVEVETDDDLGDNPFEETVADNPAEDEVETIIETPSDQTEEVDPELVEATATPIPAPAADFIPAVALDDFDVKDEDEISIPEIDEPAQSQPAALTPATGSEPEFIITNQDEKKEEIVSPTPEIRHGDHITIDHPYDARASHSNYEFPAPSLLVERPRTIEVNQAEQEANKNLIVDALRSYNIEVQSIKATIGPTVTLYEIVPAQGTRIAKIKSLEDDIAMFLSALCVRIIAPIPGKGTVGIEVPNRKPQIVSMRALIESDLFKDTKMRLPMALGKTISNDIYMADLTKLPHLLVAGATGQGKSVGLNCIITSLLYAKHPDELKFVLIDPKSVEFSLFETINRQFLAKLPEEENAVIVDPAKVIDTLKSLCVEMDNRYKLLSAARVKNLEEYNDHFSRRLLNPEDGHRFLPYIVVIVDEYADLVMVAGKDVAHPICRIAQKARAVGIHMIIATQRPSTDIITGVIKSNFPARIAFKVSQGVDSKTILDRPGAQSLIGRGDMLTMIGGVVERVQCAFVDTPEVEAICDHIGNQRGFVSCYELPEPPAEDGSTQSSADVGPVTEEFKRCALFISSQTQASITMMQRKFEIGFNKAGRFMDQMQQMGIVGPAKGAKPREVLMTPDEVARLFE
ncbi:MAG: DNA translocase FtsK [Bacteroidales bacterium]|nr:DNA translocase FtsK [Bacteroidales bacterium]